MLSLRFLHGAIKTYISRLINHTYLSHYGAYATPTSPTLATSAITFCTSFTIVHKLNRTYFTRFCFKLRTAIFFIIKLCPSFPYRKALEIVLKILKQCRKSRLDLNEKYSGIV